MYHPTLGSDHDKGQTQAGSMKDNGHILVVDDQREICDMVQGYLSGEGYRVSIAQDGVRMRRVTAQSPIDLVILDLILPGEDGLILVRWLRENFRVGIIMLTGRGDIVDHILGLEMGADYYVPKPCHNRQLLATVKSVLRRPSTQTTEKQTRRDRRHGSPTGKSISRTWSWSRRRAKRSS